ncbi:MAG: helix-turn-helix transcriptional regulator [Anaerolineales bacterium]|nr:helix-turn-helix transcriptional regulator [Anaerolineales bacterium]
MRAYELPAFEPPASVQILQSSAVRGWNDLLVISQRVTPQPELIITPEPLHSIHMIALHLKGDPFELCGHFAGRQVRGLICPGDLSLKPANVPCAASWNRPNHLLHVGLMPSLIAATAAEISQTDPVRLELIPRLSFQDPLVQQLCLALLAEVELGGLAGRLYAESLGHTLALHLLRNYASGATTHPLPRHGLSETQLRRVLDYLNDQLEQDLSLAELAAAAGYSPTYFARQFKQATGLAPHQYLIHCRVERARGLLEAGTLTVAEIAQRVGFADQSHLDRHFKHLLGVSPHTVLQYSKNVHVLDKNVLDEISPTLLQLK